MELDPHALRVCVCVCVTQINIRSIIIDLCINEINVRETITYIRFRMLYQIQGLEVYG